MVKFIVPRIKGDEKVYDSYIGSSISKLTADVFDINDNEGECLTISQKYNFAIDNLINNSLNQNDIIIFVHNDVKIEDFCFSEKIDYLFDNKKDVGVVGVIGTKEFNKSGGWWHTVPANLFGHIMQETNEKEFHLIKGNIGYCNEIVAIDGLIMAVRGRVLLDGVRFDESFNCNDFYDINFCFDLLLKTNFKIAVADILVKHKSPGLGSTKDSWKETKEKVINKYESMGLTFPISTKIISQFKEYNKC